MSNVNVMNEFFLDLLYTEVTVSNLLQTIHHKDGSRDKSGYPK